VGFVFYEKSPRCVSVETVRGIVAKMPENVEKVGVFVGGSAEDLIETSNTVRLAAVQIYPDGNDHFPKLDDEFFRKVQCDVIVAVPAQSLGCGEGEDSSGFFLSTRTRDRILAVLVDSGNSERPGGTGEKFNWEYAEVIREGMKWLGVPLIVAGGLVPENVGTAIEIFQPWGVDVSSGVEASPGKKDAEKVRAFVRAVRDMDRKVG
jgi:phosphoribosylanthranilate isomerase